MPVQGPPTLSAVAADPEDDDAQRKVRERARAPFFRAHHLILCIAAAGLPERSMNERGILKTGKQGTAAPWRQCSSPGRWTAA